MAEPAPHRMRWPARDWPSLGTGKIVNGHNLPLSTYRNGNGDSGRGHTEPDPTAGTFLHDPSVNSPARCIGSTEIVAERGRSDHHRRIPRQTGRPTYLSRGSKIAKTDLSVRNRFSLYLTLTKATGPNICYHGDAVRWLCLNT
jgi:hypothetical protein